MSTTHYIRETPHIPGYPCPCGCGFRTSVAIDKVGDDVVVRLDGSDGVAIGLLLDRHHAAVVAGVYRDRVKGNEQLADAILQHAAIAWPVARA